MVAKLLTAAGVATGIWAHTEYNQAYLKWLEAGNGPIPAEKG